MASTAGRIKADATAAAFLDGAAEFITTAVRVGLPSADGKDAPALG
jgi:hypothetical protein